MNTGRNRLLRCGEILLGCFMALSLSGCRPVLCVNPLYISQENFFDPRLTGSWETSDGDEIISLVFKPLKTNTYQVTYLSGKDAILFEGHALQLGGAHFLDLFPYASSENNSLNQDKNFRFDVIPAHMILLYELKENECQFFGFDQTWVKKRFKNKFFVLQDDGGGMFSSQDIVITAETQDLRRIILKSSAQKNEAFRQNFDVPFKRAAATNQSAATAVKEE